MEDKIILTADDGTEVTFYVIEEDSVQAIICWWQIRMMRMQSV